MATSYIHTCYRVLDPAGSEDFYVNKLGMKKVGEMDLGSATNHFFAMEDSASPMLELTHNQDRIEPYDTGALLERIRKGEVRDGDSTRSIYRKHWNKLSTPEEVNSACSVLEEFGWLCKEVIKTSGRSSTRFRLHPTLREQP